MAALDDLISQVPDRLLRERLQKALADLRKRQRFGLVFEEHIPETTAIYGLPIYVGALAQRRRDVDGKLLFKVSRLIGGKRAAIAADDGTEEIVDIKDLLLVKRFGEPMYAALKPLSRVKRAAEERPYHAVVNGENFHALQLFTYLYERKVDCIFIDPPYNIGARDWKYNNRFVDSNDVWRHSKWLAMMGRRLRLAKRLLKPDGVLVITIDEHELHHLGMLVERLFPEYLRYVVSIVVNARGSTGTRNFGTIEEQALFIVPDLGSDVIQPREAFVPNFHTSNDTSTLEGLIGRLAHAHPDLLRQLSESGLHIDDEDLAEWRDLASADLEVSEVGNGDEPPDAEPVEALPPEYWTSAVRTGQGTSFRIQRKRQFYPLFVDPKSPDRIVKVGEPLLKRDQKGNLVKPSWKPINGLVPIWPIDEERAERVWCYEPIRMRAEIATGNIRVGRFNPKRGTYTVAVRRVRRTKLRFRERTVWWERSYDGGASGTSMLKRLLGESGLFPFPKSVYEMRDILATVVGNRPDALIMDFFAGSGTTLHATCLLNAIDGGQRRCILVTNNEVDEKTAVGLMKNGHYRGDRAFEAMGIFEHVTVPRVKAAVTGRRPNGSIIPGKYRWAEGRAFADGFQENVEFFDLQYLDPEEIELGEQFHSIFPLLWLAAGGIGDRDDPQKVSRDFYISPTSPFGVLFSVARLRRFLAALEKRPDVAHVWVVTDSDEAYAEACDAFPPGIVYTSRLYHDYLRTFRVNGDQ